MTRTVAPPSISTRTLDTFYGMAQDRSGMELDEKEFYDLTNVRNNNLEGLKVRPGSVKIFSQTHTTGSKVYGVHTFLDDSGNASYYAAKNAKLYKSTGGAWAVVDTASSFANATTFFATIGALDTGQTATTTGTTTDSDFTSITDSGESNTINALFESVLKINNEKKLISGNTAERIVVKERFDEQPSSSAYKVYPRAQEFFFANGTNFYKCDGTTLTRLDNSNYAYAFVGIEVHQTRLWGWKGTNVHYSDAGIGEHFSQGSNIPFATTVKCVKSIGDVLIIYEQHRVSAIFGDNPDNFYVQTILEGVGTNAPKTVANYHGLFQFFLSEDLGIVVLSTKSLSPTTERNEPFSISKDYINDLISAQSAANQIAATGEVDEDHYHLCIDDDWYALNIKASDKTGFRKWIWTLDDRPAAQDANVLGHFGTKFAAGAQDNGQVYELESGSDDDGTAISLTIEKRNWNPGNTPSRKHFDAVRVIQAATASTETMNFFGDVDGSTYGSAIESKDLNGIGTDEHKYRFTNNPSNQKGAGRKVSFKFTNTAAGGMPEIEQLELLYRPGILS